MRNLKDQPRYIRFAAKFVKSKYKWNKHPFRIGWVFKLEYKKVLNTKYRVCETMLEDLPMHPMCRCFHPGYYHKNLD